MCVESLSLKHLARGEGGDDCVWACESESESESGGGGEGEGLGPTRCRLSCWLGEGGEGAADRVTKASALFPLSVAICFVSPASASASACASLRLASAGATMA